MVFALAGDSTMTNRPPRDRDPLPLATLLVDFARVGLEVFGLVVVDSLLAGAERLVPLSSFVGMNFLLCMCVVAVVAPRFAQADTGRDRGRFRPALCETLGTMLRYCQVCHSCHVTGV